MGVFPLADTMIRCSVAPWSRGQSIACATEWTEVWWYPHPTTPRRDAAAAHSPTDSLKPSDLIMRCFGTDRTPRATPAGGDIRPGRAGRTWYRSASAVPEFAAVIALQ